MNIKELNSKQTSFTDNKTTRAYVQFGELLKELQKKELPQSVVQLIDDSVDEINTSTLSEKELTKLVKQKQRLILKQAEKEAKIVPKNYYRNIWMIFGISIFGLPIGIAFGLSIKNLGLLGLGLPIGMAIGTAIGAALDKKALEAGRQLNIEIKN